MKKEMEKTIEQMQLAIEKNYRRVFILLGVCLIMFIAFAMQILK